MTLYPLINVAPARCQTPATVNGHIDLMIACWRWLMLWSHRNAFRSPAEKVTVPAGGHHLGNSATDCSSQLPCVVKILNYLLAKNVPERDALKSSEVNRPLSPVTKEGIIGIRGAMPAISSPQRIQLLASGTSPAFQEYPAVYTNIRGVPSQFAENSPLNINQTPHIASSQVREAFLLQSKQMF